MKSARGRLRALALLGALLIGVSAGDASAMADGPRQLVYNVKHSVFGEIGTYTNVIEAAGTATTVEYADPVDFWQARQWQTPTKTGSAEEV